MCMDGRTRKGLHGMYDLNNFSEENLIRVCFTTVTIWLSTQDSSYRKCYQTQPYNIKSDIRSTLSESDAVLPIDLDVEEDEEHERNNSNDEKPAPTVEMRVFGTLPQVCDGQTRFKE